MEGQRGLIHVLFAQGKHSVSNSKHTVYSKNLTKFLKANEWIVTWTSVIFVWSATRSNSLTQARQQLKNILVSRWYREYNVGVESIVDYNTVIFNTLDITIQYSNM